MSQKSYLYQRTSQFNQGNKKQKFTIIVRLRPDLKQDYKTYKSSQLQNSLEIQQNTIKLQRKNNQQKRFKFSSVFSPGSQQKVYQKSSHLVQSIFDGYNSTFLAYGQTGTGKTHTIFGSQVDQGFFYHSVKDIFHKIKQKMNRRQFAVRLSFVQFYLDNIYDLIANDNKKLQLKENSQAGIYIKDLTEIPVKSEEQLLSSVRQAIKIRKTQETSINKRSSRSHAVIQISLLQRWNQNGQTQYIKGMLKIVDLAGSQRVSKTQSNGNRLEQAKRINKQITTLGKCINLLAIAEKQGKIINSDLTNKFNFNKSHIPFRDSKITRFLSDSLQGKSRIILCVCASKYMVHVEQTFSSLLFASQASTLKIDSRRNQVYTLTPSVQKGGFQTPIKAKLGDIRRSTTPIRNHLQTRISMQSVTQQSIQTKKNGQQISLQLKQKLLQKFSRQLEQINYFMRTRQIKPQKQSKQVISNNLSEMNKIFNIYRQYRNTNQ